MTQGGVSLGMRFEIKHMVSRAGASILYVLVREHRGPSPGLSGALSPSGEGGGQAPAGPAHGMRRSSRGPSRAGSGPAVVAPPRLPRPGRHQRGPEISVPAHFILKEDRPVPVEVLLSVHFVGAFWELLEH